jgi:flavin reductase (DIM6/NTAB) family NADH-FMN oxidoreductase RutF
VAFGSVGVKDTVSNIREVGEFVVNLVSRAMVEAMNVTSIDAPPEVDEFILAGLGSEGSAAVRPLRVRGAPAHLECRVVHELAVGNGILVVGEVVHIHIDASVLVGPTLDPDPRLLDPVARLGGRDYTTLGEVFTLQREVWGRSTAG